MHNNHGKTITGYQVTQLFDKTYTRLAIIAKGFSGFQSTGIVPFNPNVFSYEDFEDESVPALAAAVEYNFTISPMPSTSAAADVRFSDISHVPFLVKAVSGRKHPRKVHSAILTGTPMKVVLEEKKTKMIEKNIKKKYASKQRWELLFDESFGQKWTKRVEETAHWSEVQKFYPFRVDK